jgi:hypothetical protein
MFALTAICALIWLTIRAFKTNAGWGFAVLLLSPFSATVFGVKHWEKQREPFLLYITTFTATLALCIYLFTVTGGLELLRLSASIQQGIQAQILVENNRYGLMRTSYSVDEASGMDGRFHQDQEFANARLSENTTGALNAETRAEETADIENEHAMEEKKPVRYRLAYMPIKLIDTKNYIGTTAKITRKNVPEKEYRITGASPRHIELAQRSNGGQFSFRLKNSDIDNIRVLVNEPY